MRNNYLPRNQCIGVEPISITIERTKKNTIKIVQKSQAFDSESVLYENRLSNGDTITLPNLFIEFQTTLDRDR